MSEIASVNLKCGLALGAPAAFEVARDAEDLRFLEHRAVELRRFLGLPVEPEEGGDALHLELLFGGDYFLTLSHNSLW
jgi:hypothetical protein